ncbi:unnamed protein product [Caenorhabditis sp. 36 PRJEB53466]|nr:unnamed protein product [Caenorhabditis sp. 36 PRJEB53466]
MDAVCRLGGDKKVPNQIDEQDLVEGCEYTYVRCYDDTTIVCDSVTLYAETTTATSAIGTATLIDGYAYLTCDKDGTYSWESTKKISQLYCIFVNCQTVNYCDDCNIDAILTANGGDKVVPNQVEEQPLVEGCEQTLVRCYNEDYILCDSTVLYAVTSTGTFAIGSTTETIAYAYLDCGKDGTYYWDTTKGINNVYCIFTGCY